VRIAVVYDHAAEGAARPDIVGVLESVHAVVESLSAIGHAAFPVAVGLPLDRFLSRLSGVDVTFNLAEGMGGRSEDEARVAALLELTGIPFTGASSETLSLCRRKDRSNAVLQSAGLPVPLWTMATVGSDPDWRYFPAIVKPAGEDGSVGIHEWSVVEDRLELRAALDRLGGGGLVQRFVGGRELNVGIVGADVLPLTEIEFAGSQRVVSYAAKWSAGSLEDLSTRPSCPAPLPATLREEVVELARSAWAAVGGRGYGRVDLRADEAGHLYLLDINPNPDLAPGAGLARMAAAAGWVYPELIRRITESALP
jgi:D-alanine-D-alanine ligase